MNVIQYLIKQELGCDPASSIVNTIEPVVKLLPITHLLAQVYGTLDECCKVTAASQSP